MASLFGTEQGEVELMCAIFFQHLVRRLYTINLLESIGLLRFCEKLSLGCSLWLKHNNLSNLHKSFFTTVFVLVT
jgi:hypothetical protein